MNPFDPELLLSHQANVRALVRRLIADEARVDDVVQQTLAAALQRPPRDPRALLHWLRTCARNFALRVLREDASRARRERAAAVPEATAAADELLAREACRQEVVNAVAALPEPYRTTIVLRWFAGLAPRELARRCGVPLDTVKARLRRGHDLLRVRLHSRYGPGRAWCMALAPLLPHAPSAAASLTGTLAGVVAMKPLVIGTAAACVLVLVAAWSLRPEPERGPPDAPRDPLARTAPAAPGPLADPAGTDPAAEVAIDAPAAAATRSAQETDALVTAVEGVVLDPAGFPVAGAEIRATVELLADFSIPDASPKDARVLASTTSAAGGRFRLAVHEGRRCDLTAHAPGHPELVRRGCLPGEFVTLRLESGASLVGRITRSLDGSPVEDVRVRGFAMGPGAVDLFDGTTGADGLYRFDAIPPGAFTVDVAPRDLMAPGWQRVELRPGEVRQLDFELEDGVTLHGRVTDASTGAPIEGAEISHGWTFRRTVLSGPDGSYRLPGFGARGVYDVHCRARGYGRTESVDLAIDLSQPERRVDFELHPGRTAIGRLLDRRGAPVRDAYVAAVANDYDPERRGEFPWSGGTSRIDWVATQSDEDGSFRVGGLRPDVRHALFVRHDDHGVVAIDFPPEEWEAFEVDLGTLALPAPARVSGVVVDPAGDPVAGHVVSLHGAWSGRLAWSGAAEPLFRGYVDERSTLTDALGRFAFAGVAPGDYALEAAAPRGGEAAREELAVAEGVDQDGSRLQVEVGASIAGRVEDAAGNPVPQALVLLYAPGDPERPRAMTIALVDGRFSFRGVQPGEYRVTGSMLEGKTEGPAVGTASVDGVIAGAQDVRLVLPGMDRIRGHVRLTTGGTPAHALVTALDEDGAELDQALAGADGVFELTVPPGARVRLQATAIRGGVADGRLDLTPMGGTAELEDVAAGRLDVELVLPGG